MKKKIIIIILIILTVILAASTVSAVENKTTSIEKADKIVDHTHEIETYKTAYPNAFEVEENETFDKYVGMTEIIIKNNLNGERSYHEITYTYRNGEKVIADEWSCPLQLGPKNVNRDGLIVCHVILHGQQYVKEKEPIYKNVKVKQKVKVKVETPHWKSFKSYDWAKNKKSLIKCIKSRCYNYGWECCAKGTTNAVKFYDNYGYGVKVVKIKRISNLKKSGQCKGCYKYKFIIKIKYYDINYKYVYKLVNKKVLDHVKINTVLHKY